VTEELSAILYLHGNNFRARGAFSGSTMRD